MTYQHKLDTPIEQTAKREIKSQIVWQNAAGFLLLHLTALYGLYVSITSAKLLTWVYGGVLHVMIGLGVTIGAHRYFSHRSFKANFVLRCLLATMFTATGQNSLYIWVRDHRQHHKYTDTDADPHNATRGFFFSHCGWLMVRKHPDVIAKGKTIDLSDLEADPIVRFQKKYYYLLYGIANILITALPCLLWGESLRVSVLGVYVLRTVFLYNITWLVNSAAHLYGTRPYNVKIKAVENKFVSTVTGGEGWHNFHHVFPSDYRASEYGHEHDISTAVIELMKRIGWAYDLKETPQRLVKKWVKKFGDGSYSVVVQEVDSTDNVQTCQNNRTFNSNAETLQGNI